MCSNYPFSADLSTSLEYYTYEDYDNTLPIITLEVLPNPATEQQTISNTDLNPKETACKEPPSLHFIVAKSLDITPQIEITETNKDQGIIREVPKGRTDLLEYLMRNDGTVVCKRCGEVLQSRTHWYRHKYKQHVIQPLNPSPLFQCEQCLVYFKSRKGYIGHVASRHGVVLTEPIPVLTINQAEVMPKESNKATQCSPVIKEEPDVELAIPKTSIYHTTIVRQTSTKSTETKKQYRNKATENTVNNKADVAERRSREEKLVADIIDRVRKECEAKGLTGPAPRRGYGRRTTVMNT